MQLKTDKVTLIMIILTLLAIPLAATSVFGSQPSAETTASAKAPTLPPIDASAPSTFETVSFGLG